MPIWTFESPSLITRGPPESRQIYASFNIQCYWKYKQFTSLAGVMIDFFQSSTTNHSFSHDFESINGWTFWIRYHFNVHKVQVRWNVRWLVRNPSKAGNDCLLVKICRGSFWLLWKQNRWYAEAEGNRGRKFNQSDILKSIRVKLTICWRHVILTLLNVTELKFGCSFLLKEVILNWGEFNIFDPNPISKRE